ncbi:hypothetical protein PFISCL1PPCAC_28697, partial [Pristionchus fissidentatus]
PTQRPQNPNPSKNPPGTGSWHHRSLRFPMRLLIALILLPVAAAGEDLEKLLEIDAIRVKAPRGLIKGSELVSDTPFRVATTASEDVALSLVPDAPPISIS